MAASRGPRLASSAARVAVTSRDYTEDVRGAPAPDWTVLYLDDLDDDPAPVLAALDDAEES